MARIASRLHMTPPAQPKDRTVATESSYEAGDWRAIF
jgi:hypothetical protein